MKTIEIENLTSLSYNEIDELMVKLANIKKAKDNQFKNIIKNKDPEKLSIFLKENKTFDSYLVTIMANILNFKDVTIKDMTFLDLLFSAKDDATKTVLEKLMVKEGKLHSLLHTITKCPEITTHFVNNYYSFFKDSITTNLSYIIINDEKVLDILFEKKIIDPVLLGENVKHIFRNNAKALLYGLKNDFLTMNEEQLTWIIYKGLVSNGDFNIEAKDLTDLINTYGKNIEYTFKTFDEYLVDVHMSDETVEIDKVRDYLILPKDKLELILSLIEVPKEYLLKCVKALKIIEKEFENFMDEAETMSEIKANFSLTLESVVMNSFSRKENIDDFVENLVNKIKDKSFKKEISDCILNYKLHNDLKYNRSNSPKTKI